MLNILQKEYRILLTKEPLPSRPKVQKPRKSKPLKGLQIVWDQLSGDIVNSKHQIKENSLKTKRPMA